MKSIFKLPNGLTGICDERPGSGHAVMLVMIKSGSLDEKPEDAGLTLLTHNMIFAGTMAESGEDVTDKIEKMGSVVDGGSSRLETRFSVHALTRHVESSFAVLSDIIRRPLFDARELRGVRARTLDALASAGRKPSARAGQKFTEIVFSGQQAASNPMGSPETIIGFTTDDLRRRHGELLSDPSRIVVSFAGDVTLAQMREMIERHFGDLPALASKPAAPAEIRFQPGDYRESVNSEQLNIRLGFVAPSFQSPDRHAAVMLNEILSGMSSPLFLEVREKRGLAYRIGADYIPLETAGIFAVTGATARGNAGELLDASIGVLGRLARQGFSDEVMQNARERIVRSSREREESLMNISSTNAIQMTLFGRVSGSDALQAKLERVTSDDLRRLLIEMLQNGDYALAAVGPQDGMPAAQELREKMKDQVRELALPQASASLPEIKADFASASRRSTAFERPEPRMTVLPNGLKIVTLEREGNVTCGAWVGVGSAAEPPELAGATHMNEHMMFKGTESYPPGAIGRIVEGELHGEINAFTSKDETAYIVSNLDAGGVFRAIDVCGEMVFRASLKREEFEGVPAVSADGTAVPGKGERDVVLEELRMYKDDPADRQQNALDAMAWPDHAQGRPILGNEKSLCAMDVGMLAAWRDAYYVPNNVVIGVAGPVRHEDIVRFAAEKFGHLEPRDIPAVEKPVYVGGTGHFSQDEVTGCGIQLAMEGAAIGGPDSVALRALAAVMGGSESSRLVRSLVDDKGVATSLVAGIQANAHAGLFLFKATTTPDKARAVIGGFYDELRAVAQDLTDAELARIKAGVEIAVVSGFESNHDACNIFATNALIRGNVQTPAELSASVEALTVDDLKRAARRLLTSSPTLVTVSPPGTDIRMMPDHAEVLALRDGPQQKPPESFVARPPRL